MSYTPSEQEIEKPLKNLADSITKFRDVVIARLKAGSSEWTSDHLEDLRRILAKTNELELEITHLF